METTLTRPTLYNIRQDHYELIQMIEESEGELTPEIEQALQLNQESFNEKAISYAYVVKGFENTEEIIDKEIKRLSELRDKACKRQELFKSTLSAAMQQFGVEKIETPTLKLSFRKSESINIVDENAVPLEFQEVKETICINKMEIKKAFKEGREVAGAELLIKKNLQIK